MVTTIKTWADSLNNEFSTSSVQATQYREAFYALKTMFLAAGWTLDWTGNGTTANSSDNLPNAGSVVYGTAGAQPTSYFVAASPTTWGNNLGVPMRVLALCNNSNADTTPQQVDFYFSRGPYTLAGAPLTTRPVATTDEGTVRNLTNWLPWATVTRGSWCCWYTTAGDIWFGIKQIGDPRFRSFFVVTSETTAVGQRTGVMYAFAGSGSDALVWPATLSATSGYRGFSAEGPAISTTLQFSSIAASTGWTVPVQEATTGSIPNVDIQIVTTASASANRYLGAIADVRGAPGGQFNEIMDGDTDPRRYLLISGLWMPTSAASIPLL